eukprot:1268852-Amphidinium_carterae.1
MERSSEKAASLRNLNDFTTGFHMMMPCLCWSTWVCSPPCIGVSWRPYLRNSSRVASPRRVRQLMTRRLELSFMLEFGIRQLE